MSHHSVYYVEKLEQQLRERFDKLIAAMQGRELSETEILMLQPSHPRRRVNSDDIRIAVDDFATILKEIKGSLGKR